MTEEEFPVTLTVDYTEDDPFIIRVPGVEIREWGTIVSHLSVQSAKRLMKALAEKIAEAE